MIHFLFPFLALVAPASAPTASPLLRVSGTRIVEDGTNPPIEHRFHGINICSLEWTANGEHVEQSVPIALDVWKANLIRLPLSQDRWFGKAPDSEKDGGDSYRKRVDHVVEEVGRRGKHVLLDLHWSDANVWGQNIGQHAMPDANSETFWKDCAARFANNPAVLFDLYNEPIKATWEVWRDGGPIKDKFQGKDFSYTAVGMQTLVNDVRAAGAKNLIIAGGTGYASALDGIVEHPLKDDSGNGIVYSNHFYPGWEDVDSWEARVARASETLPILIGEFGGDRDSLPLDDPHRRVAQVLDVLKRRDWNWCAWCMHPHAGPCLIENWSYEPTPYFGVLVKQTLLGQNVAMPLRKMKTADAIVFDDELRNKFQSWSGATVTFDNTAPVHGGKHSIKVVAKAFEAVQLGVVPFDAAPFEAISFWINGDSTGGQKLTIEAHVMDSAQPAVDLPAPAGKQWTHCTISFKSLGIENMENIKSFLIKNASDQPTTFELDDITLIGRK